VRVLKFVLGLAAAVVAHAVGVRLVPHWSQAVDLFTVVLTLNALAGNSLGGLAGGVAAGMAQDALTGGMFGLYGFADTIVGYVVARAAQRLVIERAIGVFPVAAAASLVQQAIVVGLTVLLLPERQLPDLGWVAVCSLVSGVAATLLYALGGWLVVFNEQRRQRRLQKLHM
jgi:rod shape-determining protein MreD